MRYRAGSLEEVYAILEEMPNPVALFDFLSGEMGYEAICAQAVGGWFFDAVRQAHGAGCTVVALAWKGCALWYENVSDHQIELDDAEVSTLGNQRHRGEPRWAWLVLKEHRERVAQITGLAEWLGPCYWAGGHVDEERLAGYVRRSLLPFRANRADLIGEVGKRLIRSEYVFGRDLPPPVDGEYIALFDRNERAARKAERNTQEWQIKWLGQLAKETGQALVVVAGLNPRDLDALGVEAVHLTPAHRDIDLLCRVVRGATLFAAPPCGAAEVACILGCDFLALGHMGIGHDIFMEMLVKRRFRAFGPLVRPDCPEADKVAQFVKDRTSC